MGYKGYKGIIVAVLCSLLPACVKDRPETRGNITHGGTGNVYIVCEGAFGNGNATLYAYQPLHDSIFGDLYKSINGQPLGDVFQSMQRISNKYFLSVNNSDKIVVINSDDLRTTANISIPKPRYILPISDTKAYISSLYNNKIYIINPQTYSVTGNITLPGKNTEGMCRYYDYVFACVWDTAKKEIYKIDLATDSLAQTLPIAGYAPQEALLDKEQMLWVLAGNKAKGRQATLSRIDPSTGALLKAYYFDVTADALKPVFNNSRDTLYFIEVNYDGGTANNGIYRMGIHDAALPEQPFIAAHQYQYYWALGIDPLTGHIYVGDPRGFIQKGTFTIYDATGVALRTDTTGLGPGHFYFDE